MFKVFTRRKQKRKEQGVISPERGQSLVEMAVIAPLLLFMFLGLIEVGWAIRGYLVLLSTNRETTRFATRGEFLDFAGVEINPYVEDVGYETVLGHTFDILNNNKLGVDLSDTSSNGAFIVSHYYIDTGMPCKLDPNDPTDTCVNDGCADPPCDCSTPDKREADYPYDDLVLMPGMPGYEHFSYTQGISSTASRIVPADLALELKEENDVLNCVIQQRNPSNPLLSVNSLIMVEGFYEQPQLLGVPFISNQVTDPVQLYNQTKMRVTSSGLSQGEGCELMPIAVKETTLAGVAEGELVDDIRNGGGSGNFGWLRWNNLPQSPAEGLGTNSQQYLDTEIRNNRLAIHDYINPTDPDDTVLNAGDVIQGSSGNIASSGATLKEYEGHTVSVPVWDTFSGSGQNAQYRVARFVKMRIQEVKFQGNPKYISAVYLGDESACPRGNITNNSQPPSPPTAVDDNTSTQENTPVLISVLTNDLGSFSPSSLSIVANPTKGAASLGPGSGKITYTPNAGVVNDTDTFQYQICNSDNVCDTATVTVQINETNQPPTAIDDNATTDDNTPIAIAVLNNDSDPDNDPLTVNILSQPAQGTAAFNAGTGKVDFTPAAAGTYTFQYEACDPANSCATATVTVVVTSTNQSPTAANDSALTNEDTPVAINVLANDTDPDNDPLSVNILTQPAHGTAVFNAGSGKVDYTPNAGYYGADSFQYEACDPGNACSQATVNITVNALPIAVNDSATTTDGQAVTIDILGNDSDPDGQIATANVISGPANGGSVGSINLSTGEITYTPPTSYVSSDSFTYQICDNSGLGACDTATVTITINATSNVIAWDDFESNSWNGGGGWAGNWARNRDASIVGNDRGSSGYPSGSSRQLRLRRNSNSWVYRTVDLAGKSGVHLQFWWRARSFEGSEKAYIKVRDGGSTWHTVMTVRNGNDNNTWRFADIDLSSYNMVNGFRIAFQAGMSGSGDQFYIDKIEVTGN